jgi:thiamine-phosphate pyrophosphorylase
VRPLARVHAITDAAVLALDDLGVRAAALASGGSAVALHARHHDAPAEELASVADRFVRLARPAEAQVFVNGRPDIARAVGAHGVQLTDDDLAPDDARLVLGDGLVGRSAHSADDVLRARDEGADFVILGHIFQTPSHAGRPLGLEELERAGAVGIPVVAIGGVTADNASSARDAGAWGVAAIRALWHASNPAEAVRQMLAPWTEGNDEQS